MSESDHYKRGAPAHHRPALFSSQSARLEGGRASIRVPGITLQDLARLMSGGTATRVWNRMHVQQDPEDEDEDEYIDEDEDDDSTSYRNSQWFPPATEPEQPGMDMLVNGEFGRVGVKHRARRNIRNISRGAINHLYRPIPLPSREDTQSVSTRSFLVVYKLTIAWPSNLFITTELSAQYQRNDCGEI